MNKTFSRRIEPIPGVIVRVAFRILDNDECKTQLSLTGNAHVHGYGSGQIPEVLSKLSYKNKWFSTDQIMKIYKIWRRYHLNDFHAGTPVQEKVLRGRHKASTYEEDCKLLESVNLLVDNGYRYGTDWLYEPIPDYVIKYLFSLPGIGEDWNDILSYISENNLEVFWKEGDLTYGSFRIHDNG